MKQGILMVGDLRPAMNFGAIATSSSLLNLLRENRAGLPVEVIDARSFGGYTPEKGYPRFIHPRIPFGAVWDRFSGVARLWPPRVLNKVLKDFRLWKEFGARRAEEDEIPDRWEEYPEAAERVLKGEFLRYEASLIKRSQMVIVNAEGSMVRNIHNVGGRYRRGARYMAFLAYLAKEVFGKPTAIVNHIFDPDCADFINIVRNLYLKVDRIAVRDPVSLKNLSDLGIADVQYVPDALFAEDSHKSWLKGAAAWRLIDKEKPVVCVGDSASIPYVEWNRRHFFGELFARLKVDGFQVVFIDGNAKGNHEFRALCSDLRVPRITVNNTSYQELGAVLGGAECFISGRWHASILATINGTPSILFGTDSHKTRALHAIVGAGSPFFDIETLHERLDQLIASAQSEHYNRQRNRDSLLSLASQFRLQTREFYLDLPTTLLE